MDILHLDDQIIVLNKPAGISVLPEGWEPDAPYLVKMLDEMLQSSVARLPQRTDMLNAAAQSKGPNRVWVIHRLDKVTSGVMVFARDAHTHRELNRQIEQREMEKVYRAIVIENPAWDEKVCKMPLRTNVGHKHRTAVDHKRGKPAETRFKVLKRGRAVALLEAQPMTGRTHQIRAHLYALGCPLLGDVLYGATESVVIHRPALHAFSLTFTHPGSGERVKFQANLPDDFRGAVEQLKF